MVIEVWSFLKVRDENEVKGMKWKKGNKRRTKAFQVSNIVKESDCMKLGYY